MRLSVLLALLPAVLAAPSKRNQPAALTMAAFDGIADQYIVRFKDGSALSAMDSAMGMLKDEPIAKYGTLIQGFAAKMDADTLDLIRNHPDVDFIEQDAMAKATVLPESMNQDPSGQEIITQSGATWGIARISSKEPGAKDYKYDSSAGEGTCSYIVDTGIDGSHADFEGRAKFVKNFTNSPDGDKHGHGTHCGGTVGSKTWGVAKKTQLFGIKVLGDNGSGSWSGIISGIEFVASDSKDQKCPKGVMTNFSLGGPKQKSVDDAITALSKQGIFVAVAAGNDNKDASNYSPAGADDICTVGSTDSSDTKSSFSNWGSTLEVFAPGSGITSTKSGGGSVSHFSFYTSSLNLSSLANHNSFLH